MPDDPAAKRRAAFALRERLKKEAREAGQRQADDRKAAGTKQAQQRRDADARRETERKTQQKREADRKAEQQKKDQQRKADTGREAAQKRETGRRAAAYVAERQRQQQADQLAEHRRRTGEIRQRHRAETRSLRTNEGEAIDRHWHAVKGIDDRETRALQAFDAKRGSLSGRAAELVKGKAHFDRERDKLQKGFEAERLKKHRDLEAVKERQFAVAQETRLRQARERKAIFDAHKADRLDLAARQESARPRLIEERRQAVGRAQEMQARQHGNERANGMTR